jgi:hypothetical protein
MSTEQITSEAMALPLPERVSLAQAPLESIKSGQPACGEAAALDDAIKRDKDLTAGKVVGRSHEDVMKAARRAI